MLPLGVEHHEQVSPLVVAMGTCTKKCIEWARVGKGQKSVTSWHLPSIWAAAHTVQLATEDCRLRSLLLGKVMNPKSQDQQAKIASGTTLDISHLGLKSSVIKTRYAENQVCWESSMLKPGVLTISYAKNQVYSEAMPLFSQSHVQRMTPCFANLIEAKKMRDANAIRFHRVSRQALCYVGKQRILFLSKIWKRLAPMCKSVGPICERVVLTCKTGRAKLRTCMSCQSASMSCKSAIMSYQSAKLSC